MRRPLSEVFVSTTPAERLPIGTRQGWMYLAVTLDLCSRKAIGWSLAGRMTAGLVCDALDTAARLRRPAPGLLFHSDRGSQYASKAFRRRL